MLKLSDAIKAFLNFIRDISNKIASTLKSHGNCLVISHYDADGLTSAAIFMKLLQWLDVSFHTRIVEQVDSELVNWIFDKTAYSCIVFLDMGSSSKSIIEKNLRDKDVIIIDHHVPEGESLSRNIIEINPRYFGIDGSVHVSTSGLCYFVTKSITGHKSIELSQVAIVGALGDRQDRGKHFSLIGLNEVIVKDGIKQGLIRSEMGLRLFGLRNRPLVKCLEYTFDPYLPGLSGDESACFNFLKSIGISPIENGKLRYFSSLTKEEIKKLATELIKHLIMSGLSVKEAERIFGITYYLPKEGEESPLYDAREYALILNACGRMNKSHLGVLLAMGYRDTILNEATKVVDEYRRLLASLMKELTKSYGKIVKELKNIILIDFGKKVSSRVVPALASLISSSRKWSMNKPLVVISEDDEKIKLSLRKPSFIAEKYEKVDLAKVMKEVAITLGGVGGGHESAAGGTFRKEVKELVINKIDELIEKYVR